MSSPSRRAKDVKGGKDSGGNSFCTELLSLLLSESARILDALEADNIIGSQDAGRALVRLLDDPDGPDSLAHPFIQLLLKERAKTATTFSLLTSNLTGIAENQLPSSDDKNNEQMMTMNQLEFDPTALPTEHVSRAKAASVECARQARYYTPNEWTHRHAQALAAYLRSLAKIERRRDEEEEELQLPDYIETIAKDRFQHSCDLEKTCKATLGWMCVFFICQVPWIIAAVIVIAQYAADSGYDSPLTELDDPDNNEAISAINSPTSAPTPTSPFNTTTLKEACDDLSYFLSIFLIIFVINLTLGLSSACARSVDQGRNAWTAKMAPTLTRLSSLTVVAISLFGVVMVWKSELWYGPSLSDSCEALRSMSVAVVVVFLLLPLTCLLCQLVFGRQNQSSSSAGSPQHQQQQRPVEDKPSNYDDEANPGGEGTARVDMGRLKHDEINGASFFAPASKQLPSASEDFGTAVATA